MPEGRGARCGASRTDADCAHASMLAQGHFRCFTNPPHTGNMEQLKELVAAQAVRNKHVKEPAHKGALLRSEGGGMRCRGP